MKRKNENKRVLRSGNGRNNSSKRVLRFGNDRQSSSNRKIRRNRNKFNRPSRPKNQRTRKPRQKRKSSGALMFVMIIALVAFVIGAGMGVSLSFDDGSDDQPHFENVTEEMTKNVNNSGVTYDKEVDGIDYNENVTSQINIQYPLYQDQ